MPDNPAWLSIRAYDVVNLLPDGWRDDVSNLLRAFAIPAVLAGGEATSLEPVGKETRYMLVNGEVIAQELPWLDCLYRTSFLELAMDFSGRSMKTSPVLRNGVNINLLRGLESYEWHVDSNPVTGLLFLDTLLDRDGGELVFAKDFCEIRVRPREGTLLMFDARLAPHRVEPVAATAHRASAPMNYYFEDQAIFRDPSIDDYLYGPQTR